MPNSIDSMKTVSVRFDLLACGSFTLLTDGIVFVDGIRVQVRDPCFSRPVSLDRIFAVRQSNDGEYRLSLQYTSWCCPDLSFAGQTAVDGRDEC